MKKKEKKRILVITPKITVNGIVAILNSIFRAVNEAEFSLAGEYDGRAPEIPSYVQKVYLPAQNKPVSYFMGILKESRHGHYDSAYIHGNNALMVLETLAVKMGGINEVIAHCHNSSAEHILIHHILKPVFDLMVSRKIACSEVSAGWAFRGHNIRIIPNGINEDRFVFDIEQRNKCRNELGLDEQTLLVGNFGRISKQKNQMFIVDILTEILKKGTDAKLLLFGDADHFPTLYEKIRRNVGKDRVIILPNSQYKASWYSALDVMIMPSLFEGLALTAIEAQVNGLPLIISDNLSPETYATKYAVKEKLDNSALKWVETLTEAVEKLPRGADMRTEVREAGLTEDQMISAIYEEII